MRIGLTGATGVLGWFLVHRFIACGHEIRALIRDPAQAGHLPAGVTAVAGGLAPDADYAEFLAGADALVHAAYGHVPGRYRRGEGSDLAGYLKANVAGSLSLMRQAFECGVGRCVFISSRAVYGGHTPGTVLSEDAVLRPDTHYGAAKAAIEAFVSAFAHQEGWPACSIRPTGIYGVVEPFHRSKWVELVGALLAGKPIAAGGSGAVHGEDVARAVEILVEAPATQIAGRAFNCGDLYVTNRQLARLVGEARGRDVPIPGAGEGVPYSPMDCSALAALGFAFGGEPALRRCIADLVARIGAGGPP